MAVICRRAQFGTTYFSPNDYIVSDGAWRRARKVETDQPLGDGTVATFFGFESRRREWEMMLTGPTRDRLDAQYQANTVATLTDEEGTTASALILEFEAGGRVRMMGDRAIYRYRIVWLER